MFQKTLSLVLCASGLSISAALGFSTDPSSLARNFGTTSATTNAPIVVTATFSNGGAFALRGFWYAEQIPSGLKVTVLGLRLNGQSVANYTFESGLDSDVYPGCTPYRWVLERPTGFTENNPVSANATVQVQYSITSPTVGSFNLQQFDWAGYNPANTNASFGYSESSDAQSVGFNAGSPPAYPILTLATSGMNFSTIPGTNPPSQTLAIANNGGGTLSWTVVTDGSAPAWLAVSPTNGVGNGAVTVSVASASLAAGVYRKAITVSAVGATNSPQTVTVTLANMVPVQGLVCYWALDEGLGTTATDASGSGNNGMLFNSPTWTAGKISGALSFNGVNNYVSTAALNLSGTRAVSVSLWANRTYSKAGGHTLFESTADFNNSTTGFGLFPDDSSTCSGGGMLAGVRGNAGYNLKCYAQPTSGVWHHLVAVFDKSQSALNEVGLYVDGILQTANAQVFSSANTNNFGTNPLYLMSRGGSGEFNNGVIDDFRVYSRALSVAEVQQLYALGTTPVTAPMLAVSPGNLTFSAVAGSSPVNQMLGITNAGGGTLSWTAVADGTAPAWLTVNPTTGTGNGAGSVTVASATLVAGTYSKNITVTAIGVTNSPQTVTVSLTLNSALALPFQTNLTLTGLQSLTVTNTATGADLQVNPLIYALQGPSGANIDTNGVIRWQPTTAQVPSTNLFTTVVSGSGAPPPSATNNFGVAVRAVPNPPEITSLYFSNGLPVLAWTSSAGSGYRVQYVDDLTDANWTHLSPDVTADGSTATTTDTTGLSRQRFYRILVLAP
jgi:hypothetical protein